MGMERKRLKAEKKIQQKMKGIKRARQAWAQKLRVDSKQRKVHIKKRIGKAAHLHDKESSTNVSRRISLFCIGLVYMMSTRYSPKTIRMKIVRI